MRQSGPEKLARFRTNPLLLLWVILAMQTGFIKPAAGQTQEERYTTVFHETRTTDPETALSKQNIFTEHTSESLITAIIHNISQQNQPETVAPNAGEQSKDPNDEEIIVTAQIEPLNVGVDPRLERRTFSQITGITPMVNANTEGLAFRTLQEQREGIQGVNVNMYGSRNGQPGWFLRSRIKGGDSGFEAGLHF